MKSIIIQILVIFTSATSAAPEWPEPSGPYLGLDSPGTVPEVFAPGLISFGFHEYGITFSPAGDEIFFVTANSTYSYHAIIHLKMNGSVWIAPEVAGFSGRFKDSAPCLSPDGKSLFFASNRPLPGDTNIKKDLDIWAVDRKNNSWGEPYHLGEGINSDDVEGLPWVTGDGTMFFQARREPDMGFDLYYSVSEGGQYVQSHKIPGSINTEFNECQPFISPDGTLLLFHSDRPGGLGIMDIYVSFRDSNGVWSEPVNAGSEINSPFSDYGARFSPDGKYLFFSSYRSPSQEYYHGKSYKELLEEFSDPRNGYATLFWIDAAVLDDLK